MLNEEGRSELLTVKQIKSISCAPIFSEGGIIAPEGRFLAHDAFDLLAPGFSLSLQPLKGAAAGQVSTANNGHYASVTLTTCYDFAKYGNFHGFFPGRILLRKSRLSGVKLAPSADPGHEPGAGHK